VEKLPELSLIDLAVTGGLVAVGAGLLLWLRMKLIGQLFLSVARAALQVLMLGIFFSLILRSEKSLGQPWASVIGSLALIFVVAVATSSRLGKSWQQLLPLILGIFLLSTGLVLGYVYLLVGHGQISIGYLPMLVGVLMATSPPMVIGVGQRFLESLQREQGAIETRLSLGATGNQWLQVYQRQALYQSLQPTLHALALTGLVTVPSLMAGLMLSGMNPLQAAAYQVVLLMTFLTHQILTAVLLVKGLSRFCCDEAGRVRGLSPH
jgi:putative ABC transport system permease protein